MTPHKDTLLWITLIALGVVVSASAKKQADQDRTEDAPPTMNVQVNDAAVRVAPSFLSGVALTLGYGEPVGVLEEGEGWLKVRAREPAVVGWMHASALTKTKIKLDAGETDANVRANREELTAGGRGFNQEVENKFREDHEELESGYERLDRLVNDPAGGVSLAEMIRFMREGELKPPAGGDQ